MDVEEHHTSYVHDAIAGAVGAACLVAAGNPFDTLKIRLQMMNASHAAATHTHPPRPQVGLLQLAGQMLRGEGIHSFWKGATPALASALIENTVVFTVNGALKRWFAPDGEHHTLTTLQHAALGGVSGIFSSTAICPAEVVKCRMQMQRTAGNSRGSGSGTSPVTARVYPNAAAAAVAIARTEGLRGLFSGLVPLWCRDVPFNFLFFGGYKMYSHLLLTLQGKATNQAALGLDAFLAGGFAGMTAWAIVFPFDSLKSRAQVRGMQIALTRVGDAAAGGAQKAPTMFAELRLLARERRLYTLYHGCSAAVLRGFPANAALFWGQSSAENVLKRLDI